MEDNLRALPPINPPNPIKTFLKKPMNESTIGDALTLHASTVLISVLIPMAVQGSLILIQRAKASQNLHVIK